MVGGATPILPEILGQPACDFADFEPIIDRSASAVAPNEKKFN